VSQTIRQRLRCPPEEWTRESVVGIAEVRLVEDVEELRSETQSRRTRDVKLTLHGGSPLRESPRSTLRPKFPCCPYARRQHDQRLEAPTVERKVLHERVVDHGKRWPKSALASDRIAIGTIEDGLCMSPPSVPSSR